MGQQKPREKPNKPKKQKNNPEWTYPRFFSQDCFFVIFGFPRVFGNQKNEKTNPEWTYPRFFSQDCFFGFFGFPRVFGQLGLGQQKPREKPNKPKKPILNGLTQDSSHRIGFFGFFGFPRVFGQLGLGQQKPREKPNKPKKPKKTNPEWTYPRFFSQDCFFVFFVFFGFPRVFGQLGFGTPKHLEKNDENQKNKKTIWNRLTPDFSHRIVFLFLFGFP